MSPRNFVHHISDTKKPIAEPLNKVSIVNRAAANPFFMKSILHAHRALRWIIKFSLQHVTAVPAEPDVTFRTVLVASTDRLAACVARSR